MAINTSLVITPCCCNSFQSTLCAPRGTPGKERNSKVANDHDRFAMCGGSNICIFGMASRAMAASSGTSLTNKAANDQEMLANSSGINPDRWACAASEIAASSGP